MLVRHSNFRFLLVVFLCMILIISPSYQAFAEAPPLEEPISEAEVLITVEFDTAGGELLDSQVIPAGSSIEPIEALREGYFFKGWNLLDGIPYHYEPLMEDTTLVATWAKQIVVSFDVTGGSTLDPVILEEGQSVVPQETLKPGYNLSHWAYPDGSEYNGEPLTESTTLKAVWVAKAQVQFEFVSSEVDRLLPDSVVALTPEPMHTSIGETVTLPAVEPVTVVEPEGVWTFDGWAEETILVDESVEVVQGSWSFNNQATVDFEFVSSVEDDILPFEVHGLLPNSIDTTFQTEITAPSLDITEIKSPQGIWKFDGWNVASLVVDSAQETFVGTWSLDKTSEIRFEYISSNLEIPLPLEVLVTLPEPKAANFGEIVVAPVVEPSKVVTPEGVWTFDTWDRPIVLVDEVVEKLVGTWSLNDKAVVSYQFISVTTGKDLPKEVMDLLPSPVDASFGEIVQPPVVLHNRVQTAEGVWTFAGWNPPALVVNEAEEIISGSWYLDDKAIVMFKYANSTAGTDVPQAVQNTLPEPLIVSFGETITPEQPATTALLVDKKIWRFNGWTVPSILVNEPIETITGLWVESDLAEVNFEFVSVTADKAIPPEVIELLPQKFFAKLNSIIVAPKLSQTKVKVYGGEWTFEGWNADGMLVDAARETFIGKWSFKLEPVITLAGQNRYETGVAVSKANFTQADTIVLAYGGDYPDALAGVPLAYSVNGPLLLSYTASLPTVVKQEIERLGVKHVIILGGPGVISPDVETTLKEMGLTTERLSGLNRYETAAQIAGRVQGITQTKEAFVASGLSFADALSTGPAAATKGMPILLTHTLMNPDSLILAISRLGLTGLTVVGGEGVIPESNYNELKSMVSTINRISGANRYETGIAIAKAYFPEIDSIGMAHSGDFPDALSGGVSSAKQGEPILLVNNQGQVHPSIVSFMKEYSIRQVTFFGGPGVIPDATKNQIILMMD